MQFLDNLSVEPTEASAKATGILPTAVTKAPTEEANEVPTTTPAEVPTEATGRLPTARLCGD